MAAPSIKSDPPITACVRRGDAPGTARWAIRAMTAVMASTAPASNRCDASNGSASAPAIRRQATTTAAAASRPVGIAARRCVNDCSAAAPNPAGPTASICNLQFAIFNLPSSVYLVTFANAAATSVFSQVNSGSLRPKCPPEAVLR